MVYNEKFVAVVKHEGKILREQGEGGQGDSKTIIKESKVTLSFGSEYSILMKNLNSRRASVKVSIDGCDVLDGKSLIIDGNSELELERFIEDLDVGNKFRFIQKTKEIVEHRGDRIDDGIVRVEVKYEQEIPICHWRYHWHYPIQPIYPIYPQFPVFPYTVYGNEDKDKDKDNVFCCNNFCHNNVKANVSDRGADVSFQESRVEPNFDEGITVKGSKSSQKFGKGYMGLLENVSHVIIIRLRGIDQDGICIEEAIGVKTKLDCPTCGRKSKSNVKFCPNCGTCLVDCASL